MQQRFGSQTTKLARELRPSYDRARNREMKRTRYLRLHDYAGWHCDSCARLILSVSDGWVEWLASEDESHVRPFCIHWGER